MTATDPRPRVLSLLGCYWPGHDASGPNQSYRAMTAALSGDFNFAVISRDRAFDAAKAAEPALSGRWATDSTGEAFRSPPRIQGLVALARLLRDDNYDILVLNGAFDRDFTLPALWLRRLGLVPRKPAILSSRGEFASGALHLKSGRKQLHLWLAKIAGLMKDVTVHATSDHEHADNLAALPFVGGHVKAANLTILMEAHPTRRRVAGGPLNLIFVGRITPVKNLHFALERLAEVKSAIRFTIVGPIADEDYWKTCGQLISALPSHVEVDVHGAALNADMPRILAGQDALLLPSLGENFGHAIYEALACSVPVIISDRTPWRDLAAKHAGWDLPLDQPDRWAKVIDELAQAGDNLRCELQDGARSLAARHSVDDKAKQQIRTMFRNALKAEA